MNVTGDLLPGEKLKIDMLKSRIGISASPILLRFCSQLYDLNARYRNLTGRALAYKARDVARAHADIPAAALGRDADLASKRLLHHYRQTGDFLSQSGQIGED